MQAAHICVIQPGLDLDALLYLDHAQYLQRALRSLGVDVSVAKNRWRRDRVNLVLGSHLGADPEALRAHPSILVNLESLLTPHAGLSAHYLTLLRANPVLDIDARHAPFYLEPGRAPAVLRLGGASASGRPVDATALAQRPIGLLYHGVINHRTAPILSRIEQCGVTIARPDGHICGPELASLVGNAKAVLQLLDTDLAGFDVKLAAPTWWAGTPLVAERPLGGELDPAYSDVVHWFTQPDLADFFSGTFKSEGFHGRSSQMLAHLARQDVAVDLAPLLEMADRLMQDWHPVEQPVRLNLACQAGAYRAGWINASADARLVPDVQADLRADAPLPPALLAHQGQVELIDAGVVDPGSPAARSLFAHALDLLKPEGLLVLSLPRSALHAGAGSLGWSRQSVDEALADVDQCFWRSGWLTHRLAISHVGWLDVAGMPLTAAEGGRGGAGLHQVRVVLRKAETSYAQRAVARIWREDFALN